METYHEWMKAVLLVSISGCPALAVPAGFAGERDLPMGLQIIAPNHGELDCLRLGHAQLLEQRKTAIGAVRCGAQH
jgi:amidase